MIDNLLTLAPTLTWGNGKDDGKRPLIAKLGPYRICIRHWHDRGTKARLEVTKHAHIVLTRTQLQQPELFKLHDIASAQVEALRAEVKDRELEAFEQTLAEAVAVGAPPA